jgi:hypothetical protein
VNDDFYFDIDVDDECRLRNVFWASYEDFGDVVILNQQIRNVICPFCGSKPSWSINHFRSGINFK